MLSDAQTQVLAAVLLAAIPLGLALWTMQFHRRLRQTWAQIPLRWLNLLMVRIVWRTTISGPLPIGPDQGAVIVCNHISPTDPAYIALATDRMVRWMVAREYCQNWLLGPGLRALEVIPVGRGGIDTAATKNAIRSARAGRMIGMFPEGRINRTREFLQPGRPGAVMVALKARVPIVPCYLEGAPYDGTTLGCFFMLGKARLTVGRPIDLSEYYGRPDDKQLLDLLTKRLLSAIAELAGKKDFVPRVAGRRWNEQEGSPPEVGRRKQDAATATSQPQRSNHSSTTNGDTLPTAEPRLPTPDLDKSSS